MTLVVAEGHVVEAHVAAQGDEPRREHGAVRTERRLLHARAHLRRCRCAERVLPHSAVGSARAAACRTAGRACSNRALTRRHRHERAPRAHAVTVRDPPRPCIVARPHELHAAVVHLGRLMHHGEHALRAGKRREQEVRLLGELVDGHGRLPHEHEVAREHAHVRPAVDGHPAAEHRHDRVVHVADGHDRGHHRGRIRLRARARHAQALVLLAEGEKVGVLVVEHLHDLLPAEHLLDVPVELAEHPLLPLVERAALLRGVPDVGEHADIAQHHDERELPVEHEDHDERAHDLDERLDDHREAVVHGLGHGVDVVRKVAHDVAAVMAIEEAQRQRLDVREKVAPDFDEHALRRMHHELSVAERREHAHAVDAGGEHDAAHEVAVRARGERVDHRPDHVRAQKVRRGGCGDEHRHRAEHELVPAEVREQLAYRSAQVLGLVAGCSHQRAPPSLSNDAPGDNLVSDTFLSSGAADDKKVSDTKLSPGADVSPPRVWDA